MTDAALTRLCFLLDRSGSMQSIKTDTGGSFAASSPSSARARVAAASRWHSSTTRLGSSAPISTSPSSKPPDPQPRGTTALLDAIGRLVTEAG